ASLNCILQALLHSEVADYGDNIEYAVVDHPGIEVAALAAHLELVLERLQLSRLERPPDARDEPPDQLGRKRVVNRQTYQLLRRSDEPAAIPLHLEVHAFAVRPDHHVRQDSQQCLAARFGPAELLKAAVLFKCETCCGEDLLQQLGLVLERR